MIDNQDIQDLTNFIFMICKQKSFKLKKVKTFYENLIFQ